MTFNVTPSLPPAVREFFCALRYYYKSMDTIQDLIDDCIEVRKTYRPVILHQGMLVDKQWYEVNDMIWLENERAKQVVDRGHGEYFPLSEVMPDFLFDVTPKRENLATVYVQLLKGLYIMGVYFAEGERVEMDELRANYLMREGFVEKTERPTFKPKFKEPEPEIEIETAVIKTEKAVPKKRHRRKTKKTD